MPRPTTSPSRDDGVTIACPICTRPFVPVGRQRVCSAACRQAAYRRRQQAQVPAMCCHPSGHAARGRSISAPRVRRATWAPSAVRSAACSASGSGPAGSVLRAMSRSPSPTSSTAWEVVPDGARQDQHRPPPAHGRRLRPPIEPDPARAQSGVHDPPVPARRPGHALGWAAALVQVIDEDLGAPPAASPSVSASPT